MRGRAGHHFVCFTLNKKGQIIEFDGTKVGPHVIKESTENLVKDVATELLARVADGKISEKLSVLTLSSENF